MIEKTVKAKCRWCRKELSIQIPVRGPVVDMLPALPGMLLQATSRMGCNRCSDYYRGQSDRADRLQRTASRIKDAGEREAAILRDIIKAVVGTVVQAAEDHYLISGLVAESNEFVRTILQQPEYAASLVRVFDRKANELAARTHNPSVQTEIPEGYAY